MSDVYDNEWTIRGLIDVKEDIFLKKEDQLKISGSGTGPYAIEVLKGNEIWETCNDLMLVGDEDPSIPVGDEQGFKDTKALEDAVRTFVGNYGANCKRLEGTLTENKQDEQVKAEVKIWTPKVGNLGYYLIIIRVKPAQGPLLQNGTGHGDNR